MFLHTKDKDKDFEIAQMTLAQNQHPLVISNLCVKYELQMFLYETYEPDTVLQKDRWAEIQGDYYIPLQTVFAEGVISSNIYLKK